jgi:hypothetical protein
MELCSSLIDPEHPEIVNDVQYWLNQILGTLTTLALVMNGMIIFILAVNKKLKERFSFLFMNLLLFDTLLLVSTIVLNMPFSFEELQGGGLYLSSILQPIGKTALSGSIYMTIILYVERYIHSGSQATERILLNTTELLKTWSVYVLPVVVFAILFNLPAFFEFTVFETEYNNETVKILNVTSLRTNQIYVRYYSLYANMIISTIFPSVCLFCCYLMTNRRMKIRLKKLDQSNQRLERDLARLSATFAIIFSLCSILPFLEYIYKIKQFTVIFTCGSRETWFLLLTVISEFIICVNSGIRPIIFLCMNTEFRSIFLWKKRSSVTTENIQQNDESTPFVALTNCT